MKHLLSIFILVLVSQQIALAQCNSGPVTISGNAMITGSCTITGDLTLLNGSTLNVDLSAAGADTFVVRGNILLQGNAVMWVHTSSGAIGDQFIVSNSSNNQRSITTQDSSRMQLENIEFRTQEGDLTNAASIYMNYYAQGQSILYINKSWLDPQKAWLLGNMNNRSTLLAYEPNHLPTEIYVQDTAQISLHGPNTNTGLWLNFQSITTTLNLPADQTQPYTWMIGRSLGGLNTQWYLEIDSANPGLGVQIMPDAHVTVNGSAAPAKELTVALLFANGTDTLKDLTVGLQNRTVATGINGGLTLNNVNLGPIAWQLYALMNEHLYVKNSIINEIGIAGPSTVTVDSSLLQLAVLAAVGVNGSTMTINNSEIWNQQITAANHSNMTLNNCKVTGSIFNTADTLSHITVNGGCFYSNPTGCTPNTMINMTTGQPYCNPYMPAGFPQNLTPAAVTFNGVGSNCTTGINETENSRDITIYPNPASDLIHLELTNSGQNYSVEILSILGQQLLKTENNSVIDMSNIPAGIYLVVVRQDDNLRTAKIVKQ